MIATKITISDIPDIFPEGYEDVFESEYEITSIGQNIENQKETWGNKTDFLVVSHVWNRYEISIPAKPELRRGLETSKYAGKVEIDTSDGKTHLAGINNISIKKVKGSYFTIVKIDYKDLNSEKISYHGTPKTTSTGVSVMTLGNFNNDGITPRAIDSIWNDIIDENGKWVVKSLLPALVRTKPIKETISEQSGKGLKRRTDISREVRFKGYFNEYDAVNLAFYLPLVSNGKIVYNTATYIFQEKPKSEDIIMERIEEDYYSIEFGVKYQILNYNHKTV